MANLFIKQAKMYVETRPSYPTEFIEFIASKTLGRHLAWDAGTGNGQAAFSLAKIFKDVVATDTSEQQLSLAPNLPNIRYQQTPPTMSIDELERHVASESTVDLVTIAQALHWFDHPIFYEQVKRVLKKPNGVIAGWCYSEPEVNDAMDAVYSRVYKESAPYWAPQRKFVDYRYRTIDFPFEPVEGEDHTGPFQFEATRSMDLESYFTYIRSWSAYQTAGSKGVELLKEDVVKDFERAWGDDRTSQKIVRFPIYLRIGRVERNRVKKESSRASEFVSK
ncbi:putative methyltransferase DDB_G0268948 [Telopea speciosissima]|uniref:putative methyltransferase DDB_G0268948 n=1 Tax=Telopea speciosissima TaxID=54955 RepID=UPI001CC5CFF0|nr:putative methyltransferase DDB_G0268948 [Telopea speciosissima]